MTCRGCKEVIDSLDNYVRTGPRQTQHWNCWLEPKSPEKRVQVVKTLPLSQLARIPWRIPDNYPEIKPILAERLVGL